jgi:tripartite-type tricarboxylate transporter receptor subunit TctC
MHFLREKTAIVGVDNDAVKVGDKVQAVFESVTSDVSIPRFCFARRKIEMCRIQIIATLSLMVLPASVVLAQNTDKYPTKPIRVIVPQPPGGTTDAVARLFGYKMTDVLGQQIVIDNRAGGGVAGLAVQSLVANANPDGYTLLAVTPNFTFIPAMLKKVQVRPEDFAPVTLMSRDPYLLSIYPGLAAKSVKEFIALAKSKPNTLNMGSGNIGAGTHLISMFFLTEAGIRNEVTYVPYKGTGLAFNDLIAGRLQASVTSIVSGGPHVRAGRLRALGVTSAQRSAEWPDVPTIGEQGLPGFEAIAWYGLVAPLKTPVAIVNQLGAAARQAARSADVSTKIKALGGEAVGSTPAEFRQIIDKEIPLWRALIKELGMTGSLE